MKKVILITLLVCFVVPISAQRLLQGTVYDKTTKETLIGAYVIPVGNHAGGVATDEKGKFSVQIPVENASIAIQYIGFDNDTLHIGAKDSVIAIYLSRTKQLSEFVVEARVQATEVDMFSTAKVYQISNRELLKAACCNLSESFETTPSVDIGFTDAVSGYKQIQMLGLTGAHTLITRENIPDVRGLAAITGLTFTPGTWVESMQLSKGAGSVVNGFEGTAGQINVEWLKPFEDGDRLLLNIYQSVQGRTEGNAVFNQKINDHVSTNVLFHASSRWLKVDDNKDNFMDQPIGEQFMFANRWFYFSDKGWEFQAGIKGSFLNNEGGQIKPTVGDSIWKYTMNLKRIEGWAKIGKMFKDKPWKSMGLQLSGGHHAQNSIYGARQYKAQQSFVYANYIFQTQIKTPAHIIKTGASFSGDFILEQLDQNGMYRNELTPGAFFEYAFDYKSKVNVVAGVRADYHSLYGFFATPRLHIRYSPVEKTAIRFSAGRAQRTPFIFAENMGIFASNRAIVISVNNSKSPYGLDPEVAWNFGVNFTQKFRLNYRDGSFGVDFYHTLFQKQVVVDIEKPGEVHFYNLNGASYSNSLQAQVDYEIIRNFNIRIAYRWLDVKMTYLSGLKEKPLIASHRAFVNLGYETKNGWHFDVTGQFYASSRLPERYNNEGQTVNESYSPSFFQLNAQISKFWKWGLEVYLGGENLTNYMQPNLIIGYQNPFAKQFDGSLVWGSAMGWNMYIGARYRFK